MCALFFNVWMGMLNGCKLISSVIQTIFATSNTKKNDETKSRGQHNNIQKFFPSDNGRTNEEKTKLDFFFVFYLDKT